MSHQITVPIGPNGMIDPDEKIQDIVSTVISPAFGTTDVFIYSHGWWTTADDALKEYNVATTDFSLFVRKNWGQLTHPSPSPLSLGIHWPSEWIDDPNALSSKISLIEAFSFYKMEKRAEDIGEEGLYAILRLFVEALPPGSNLRIHLIGHSFGCKVVCSALNELAKNKGALSPAISFNVILLQAAFPTPDLELGKAYSDIITTYGGQLRMLITKSAADTALNVAFPLAHATDFFVTGKTTALGATGPTPATITRFAANQAISVNFGDTFVGQLPAPTHTPELVVADLTPVHTDPKNTYDGGWGGHHSDIFRPEIYDLMAWFLLG